MSSGFKFSKRSKRELKGVHPDLVRVTTLALDLTKQDFLVVDGIRTIEEQRRHVRNGASRTMKSKHLKQADGWGHAVDLVPWIEGKPIWQPKPLYVIADAMRKAATELHVKVRWGGNWKLLNNTTAPIQQLVDEYVALRRRQGRRPFVDSPHFEIRL